MKEFRQASERIGLGIAIAHALNPARRQHRKEGVGEASKVTTPRPSISGDLADAPRRSLRGNAVQILTSKQILIFTWVMRGKPIPNSNGGGKMTVMVLQLEGGDATLQQAIHTIRTALENMGGKGGTPKLLTSAQAASSSVVDTTPAEATPTEVTEETNGVGSPVSASDEGPKRQAKERSPKIIQLDFTKNKPCDPLKEFMHKHGQKVGVNMRYLLCAYWLKENLGVQEVSADHMHTCFREMDWTNLPTLPTQPLRTMKTSRYGWFEKVSGKGLYKLTHVGESKARATIKGDKKA